MLHLNMAPSSQMKLSKSNMGVLGFDSSVSGMYTCGPLVEVVLKQTANNKRNDTV